MKNTTKNYLATLFIIVCCLFCGYVEAQAGIVKGSGTAKTETTQAKKQAKQDKAIIRNFVKRNFGKGYKIIIRPAMKTTNKELAKRAGKKLVYVDVHNTVSNGKKGGYITDKGVFKGRYTNYAAPQRKGKRVKVYLIYNPDSNYTDDIIAIVNNGKLKY